LEALAASAREQGKAAELLTIARESALGGAKTTGYGKVFDVGGRRPRLG